MVSSDIKTNLHSSLQIDTSLQFSKEVCQYVTKKPSTKKITVQNNNQYCHLTDLLS